VRTTDVVVIGAGQAGLSSAYYLPRYGFTDYVVLDAGSGPGGAWRHRWPSLRLDKVHGFYPLPGFPPINADARGPASEIVSSYFASYEQAFDIPVRRPVRVSSITRSGDRLVVATDHDTWAARAVISATGTWTHPFWPYYPGMADFRGRQLHTADYTSASEFSGQRVIVVGGGTSAVELVTEISQVASETTWITRQRPVIRSEPFSQNIGRQAVALVDARVRAGLPPESVVSVTGLWVAPHLRPLLDAVPWRPIFQSIVPSGVRWQDGSTLDADVIVWATGFRAAVDHLAPLGLRTSGGGILMDGTKVVAEPRLHLVGYGPSASTIGANRAGRAAVRSIRDLLGAPELAGRQT
jgi:cation diffusion facilitator CzcD-associated flavoprotein CzcO